MNFSSAPFQKATRNRKTLLFVLALIFFFGTATIFSAETNDLQTAASRIDKLITKSNRTTVIVTDFIGPKNAVTEYGQAIADELSTKLAKANPNLTVMPRTGQTYSFGNKGSADFGEGGAAWFLARSLKTEIVVTGNLEKHSDGAFLYVRVWDIPTDNNQMPGDKLDEFTLKLSISPEQKILLGRTVPLDPPQGFRLTAGKKPSASAGFPTCIACTPPYGVGKAQVILLIDISAKGLVTHAEVVSTTNQKITDKVVKTAMSWRFRPAVGPEGQPIATQIQFELSLGNEFK